MRAVAKRVEHVAKGMWEPPRGHLLKEAVFSAEASRDGRTETVY